LVLAFLLLGMGAALFFQVQPFLAITDRVPADVMVVEGWLPRYAINAAVSEFKTGAYQRAYTTGGPVQGGDFCDFQYETAAQLGAARLSTAGLAKDVIQEVPCKIKDRDRTYSSAIALRDWLRARHLSLRSLNVVTVGVHARRTQLLYQMAFGNSVKVGIISVPDDDYPAARWWQYSDGVRSVIGETIAYLYAKLLFTPRAGPLESTASASIPSQSEPPLSSRTERPQPGKGNLVQVYYARA
jgi:uncharacterized SAM-binding protein YcdF (DUF218 family)